MSTGMEIVLPSVRQHEAVLIPRLGELDKWAGGGEAGGEALIRYTMAELSVNDDLRSCTPTSLYLALLSCAVTGLVPGKLKGYSYLVPFGNTRKGPDGKTEVRIQEATFMAGWKGVKHIGYRSGLHMISAVIHENDVFDYDVGTTKFVKYRQALKAPGPEIGAAAWCELPNGGLEVEYLNMAALNDIKESANRLRKSPAWNGAFADQMRRKSALKRLGKQLEMGEQFFKLRAIEEAEDEYGDQARGLDEVTDGAASKFLGQQTTEAATFGHLPRPTQVQSAGVVGTTNTGQPVHQVGGAPADGKLAAATDKARAADKKREGKNPTQSASTSSTSQAGSSSASPSAGASTSSAPASSGQAKTPTPSSSTTASPTSPTPATTTATSASSSSPASASPAASSSGSSASSTTTPSESSASGDQDHSSQNQSEEFGDVAGEPSADDDFSTAFGSELEESDDPVDRQPSTRADWIGAFGTWAAAHPTLADVRADLTGWTDILKGWARACSSKAEMDEGKPVFQKWAQDMRLTFGRKADPSKGLAAVPPDNEIVQLQNIFRARYDEVQ